MRMNHFSSTLPPLHFIIDLLHWASTLCPGKCGAWAHRIQGAAWRALKTHRDESMTTVEPWWGWGIWGCLSLFLLIDFVCVCVFVILSWFFWVGVVVCSCFCFSGKPHFSAGQKPKGITTSVEEHLHVLYFRNMIQPFWLSCGTAPILARPM